MESIYVIRTVLLLGVLLVLSAVFSAIGNGHNLVREREKLLALQERHPFSKTFLAWLLADVQRALTITLISNNLVNIAASAVATSLAIMLFGSSGVWLSVCLHDVSHCPVREDPSEDRGHCSFRVNAACHDSRHQVHRVQFSSRSSGS